MARKEPLRITSPPDGAVYLRDPTLRAAFQTVPLRAAGAPGSELRWEVDGASVGASAPDRTPDWPLRSGTHTIEVTDGEGQRDQTTIVVR